MKFKRGDIPDTWNGVFEGIDIGISIHPIKGLAFSFFRVDKRTMCEGEIFIPVDSDMQQIAQTLVKIHEMIYGKD